MLTLLHDNVARIDAGHLVVDRKFHLGMRRYVGSIESPMVTVHPEAPADAAIMDAVRVPLGELGYGVLTVDSPDDARLQAQLRASRLVYGSRDGLVDLARALGVPYLLVREYDLQTRIIVAATSTTHPLRRVSRALKVLRAVPAENARLKSARGVHCNGYPIHAEVAAHAARRLLYLDSRMTLDDLVDTDALEVRLATLVGGRTVRLLYSGRYEPLKGALDAVKSVSKALALGADVSLACYGQGSQIDAMRALAARAGGRIAVHDAIPFPELVDVSRGFDLFVACHIQNDPSCTYLESMGSGLPIAGYGNRMWRGLLEASGAGVQTPMKRVDVLARAIVDLVGRPAGLADLSRRARAFAAAHTFEREFALRTDDINATLRRSAAAPCA